MKKLYSSNEAIETSSSHTPLVVHGLLNFEHENISLYHWPKALQNNIYEI